MLWRRHRGTSPSLTPLELRTSWQAISWLLDYPTVAHRLRAPGVRAAIADLPAPVREPLGDVLEAIESQPLARACRATTSTPSTSPASCALHLTYYTCGDTRKRGSRAGAVQAGLPRRRASSMTWHERTARPPVRRPGVRRHVHDHADIAWKLLCDQPCRRRAVSHRALTVPSDSAWLPVVRSRCAQPCPRTRRHRRGSPRPAHRARPAQRTGRPRPPRLRHGPAPRTPASSPRSTLGDAIPVGAQQR
jgi:nitrate reductase delta subunit